MNRYTKNGVIYNTPIKIKRQINGVKMVSYTIDEKLILANGYQVYNYKPQPTVIDIKQQRFSKYKVKQELEKLGLWQAVKQIITEQMYEDLLIADDFAFDDSTFVSVYETLKEQIENIDELLLKCVR